MAENPLRGFIVIPAEVARLAVKRCQACGLPAQELVDFSHPVPTIWWELFIDLAAEDLGVKRQLKGQ
jgi:hypothetical protein